MNKIITSVFVFLLAGSANATVINFGPTSASGSGPLVTFTNLTTPTSIIGDATITLNVNGDFNSSSEYADIILDGFSLGRILDNLTSNDPFNFVSDIGNQSSSTITGTATIANINFAPLIADGLLDFSFDTSSGVNCCGTLNVLSGSISFQEGSAIPEPTSLALLGLGLAGFGFSRKKKST